MGEVVTTGGWRQIVVQLGHGRAVLMITMFSVVMSVLITAALIVTLRLQRDEFVWMLLIGAIVPALVAPMASHLLVQLLFELEFARTHLQHMAWRDSLTEAYNRAFFLDRLAVEAQRSRRLREPLSLLMIDADEFKSINDRYGHSVGDRVLQEISRVASSTLRAYDVFARYGGEEFAVLLPNVTLQEAYIVAERLRQAVAAHQTPTGNGSSISATVSVGVSGLMPNDPDGMKLLDRADALLYEAKRAGRNRVA